MIRFGRFISATSLRRELTWALLLKFSVLGLIGEVLLPDSAPTAVDAVRDHLLHNNSADRRSVPTPAQDEQNGSGIGY